MFGLQVKNGTKISDLSGEWPWRGYLTLLSFFLLSLSKSLYVNVAGELNGVEQV